jgi:shikimate kinase/3-dehydroquinate synthase
VVGQDVGALRKHIALIGFMGAGKSTIGREVARLTERPFVDLDEEIEKLYGPIGKIFDERGEPEFRRIEEQLAAEVLATDELSVIALGGGAVLSEATQHRLARRAFTVEIEVHPEEAWQRTRGSDRPLARDKDDFMLLFARRKRVYADVADSRAIAVEQVLHATLCVSVWPQLSDFTTVDDPVAVVCDERVAELHPLTLFSQVVSTHPLPAGEETKRLGIAERLWSEMAIGRDGTVAAFGGGTIIDVAGFVAATYLRGVRWIAVPTTLLAQVDAAIGGKTGIDLRTGKNVVGAFHFPGAVRIGTNVLTTLPETERRAGMAEVLKTGLLAGRAIWELGDFEMVSAGAAFKCAVVLSDPYETKGRRTILNLGHTFAHALETGSGYTVRHGDAVALGLLAALRLSGQPTEVVEELLRPERVWADPDAAWAALKRDKKGEGVFVLLEAPGKPVVTTVPDEDARRALEALIQK